MEVWRNLPIPGLEHYQVSNLGRVRNTSYKGTGIVRDMTPCVGKDGYLMVCLTTNRGKQRNYWVHRLVATAFIPSCPEKDCVNHKNECKTDNRVENLEWVDRRENDNYGTRNARMAHSKLNGNSKQIVQQTLDGKVIHTWPSISAVNRVLGYDTGLISKCCKGKKKTAYGFLWEYAPQKEDTDGKDGNPPDSGNGKDD